MPQFDTPPAFKSNIDHAPFFSDCNEHEPTAPTRTISFFNSPARHARFPLPQIIPRRLRARNIIGAFEHPAGLKALAAFRLPTVTSLQNGNEQTRRRGSRFRRGGGGGEGRGGAVNHQRLSTDWCHKTQKSTNHFPHPNSKRENLIRHREDRGFERENVKRVVPARGTYAWVHHSRRGVG